MKKRMMLFTLFLAFPLYAKDFGRIGATFPIGEIDMLVWIEQRLKGFEASGKMADMKQAFIEKVQDSIETPPPLALSTTRKPKVFYVDPSLKIAKDIVNPYTNDVIAKAGTIINPFDPSTWPNGTQWPTFEYSHTLAFFDARDSQQVAWAKALKSAKPIKWILTGGSPNDMAGVLSDRIYFDQQGNLTQKLHITSVPSLVEQASIHWKVTEFDVSELSTEE